MGKPMLRFQSRDQLRLSFDEITEADARYLNYRIVHCNADGTPSDMQEIQYLEGGYNNSIDDIRFSLNTYTSYSHYELLFPDENTTLKLSGNYRVEVFDANNAEEVLLSAPFMVYEEQLIDLNGSSILPKRVEYRRTKQEFNFTIQTLPPFEIIQPYQNLQVFVQQNGDQTNIRSVQPHYVVGNTLTFSDSDELLFDGANEYRNFDLRPSNLQGSGVDNVFVVDDEVHVQLYPFLPRPTQAYTSGEDINGHYVVEVTHNPNPPIEANYAHVDFQLQTRSVERTGAVYVYGELTHWTLNDDGRMHYNMEHSAYETSLFLKQGFYDFMFVYVPHNDATPDFSYYEGNHTLTKNTYTVYVYYRSNADGYDRLIGFKTL
ncbi:hypothetical protein FACS1894201_07320 [Bacteroidia bacterium]|nr:hypothetical protein FACS1894201_07320 [Bacteroidia bacterium]